MGAVAAEFILLAAVGVGGIALGKRLRDKKDAKRG